MSGYYLLLASGSRFISDGGYEEEFRREKVAEDLQINVYRTSISVAQSVEETNKQIIANNNQVNKILKRSLLASLASVAVAAGS
jgi:hypothetical protein